MNRRFVALVGAAAASVSVGCDPKFDDPTTVKDLRVLAIVADTPEVVVDDVSSLPETFPPITLRPLVVDPRGQGRSIQFRLVVCPNHKGEVDRGRHRGAGGVRDTVSRGPCPVDAELIAEGLAAPPTNPPDVVVPMAATFVPTKAFLMKALEVDPDGKSLGLPITIELNISAGDEHVIALKRIVFVPRLRPEQTPNRNPEIPALVVRPDGDGPASSINLAVPAMNAPVVHPGGTLLIEPGRAEAERYETNVWLPLAKAPTVEVIEKETLRYAFFSTMGTFSPGQVSTEPPRFVTNAPDTLETTYHARDELGPGDPDIAHVWVIVRDERGGTSFVRAMIRLR